MAIKHNNVVPNPHFRKWWQRYVKTWFNQTGRKKSRRVARQQKAAKCFPRPTGKLRPLVHCPTVRYNHKVRAGKGFTLQELKKAGIPKLKAPTIGIAVDHRRKNHCEESLNLNVARLQEYMGQLKVLPKNAKKAKKGDATGVDLSGVTQNTCKTILPVPKVDMSTSTGSITKDMKDVSAYRVLRKAREVKKNYGKKIKRALEKAEKASAKK